MRITTFNISLENSAQDLLTLVFVDGELPSNILIRPDNIIITCVFNTLQASAHACKAVFKYLPDHDPPSIWCSDLITSM